MQSKEAKSDKWKMEFKGGMLRMQLYITHSHNNSMSVL